MSTDTNLPVKKRRRRNERNAALMDENTLEFIQAIDTFRRKYDKSFPAWSEVLDLLKSLGYRKVAEPVPYEQVLQEVVEPLEDGDQLAEKNPGEV